MNSKNNKQTVYLILLSSIFTSSLIIANLVGSKLVEFFGFTFSSATFVFPFTFISVDIIAEIYGKKTALSVVKIGVLIQVYVLCFIQFVRILPSSHLYDISTAYEQMFSLTPRMILASITAYSISLIADVNIFVTLKEKFFGKNLLLRTNISNWISQFIDTAIFIGIFLGGILPIMELIKTFTIAYLAKMIVATFDSPLVKLGVNFINKKLDS